MKEVLIENGWYNYATGCACQGLPRYYKHQDYPEYRIVTKGGCGIIKKSGIEIFKTKVAEELISKIKEMTN